MDIHKLFLNDGPITAIEIEGFKSIKDRVRLSVRPLTVLAGANSSGKSSAIQPFLLMKQTLEVATNAPGPLLLRGPNVSFNRFSEILSRNTGESAKSFRFRVEHEVDELTHREHLSWGDVLVSTFVETSFKEALNQTPSVEIEEWIISTDAVQSRVEPREFPLAALDRFHSHFFWSEEEVMAGHYDEWIVRYARCLPEFYARLKTNVPAIPQKGRIPPRDLTQAELVKRTVLLDADAVDRLKTHLTYSIHLPGLRDHPAREYTVAAKTVQQFPQLFQNYVATLLVNNDENLVARTAEKLCKLGLTSSIETRKIDDTRIEVLVDRLPVGNEVGTRRSRSDMVSIADVGIGVSQVLPVVMALQVAVPGQLVYIEQPELHLHPRAQHKLAELLVEAANRGVRVVVETHSDLLLLGIREAVAKSKLDPANLAMHWFSRDDEGFTKVTTAVVDEYGRSGDWPVDFGDVDLNAQAGYLDAVESRHFGIEISEV